MRVDRILRAHFAAELQRESFLPARRNCRVNPTTIEYVASPAL